MRIGMLALSLLVGCFAQAATGTLNMSVGPQNPYVLPIGLTSCKGAALGSGAADISSNSLEFTRFNYSWNGEGSYTMSAIVLSFTDANLVGGKYQCVIAGDELDFVLPAGGKTIAPWDLTTKSIRCTLKCGGVSISSSADSLQIQGEMKVMGMETDANGNSQPITSTLPVSMTYQKF
jgi:hypothetical protein